MNWGFIKTAAAVPHVRVGEVAYNLQQIEKLLDRAAKAGAEIVVFPELGLTGYTCADLFHQTLLLQEAEQALEHLVAVSKKCPALCAVGLPVRVENVNFRMMPIFSKNSHV